MQPIDLLAHFSNFAEPGRYICWHVAALRVFVDKKPDLRAALQGMVNSELARKVESAMLFASRPADERP